MYTYIHIYTDVHIYIYILTKVVFNCSYLGYRAGKKNLLYITKKYLFFNYTLKFCCFYFYFILYIYIYYIYIYIFISIYQTCQLSRLPRETPALEALIYLPHDF